MRPLELLVHVFENSLSKLPNATILEVIRIVQTKPSSAFMALLWDHWVPFGLCICSWTYKTSCLHVIVLLWVVLMNVMSEMFLFCLLQFQFLFIIFFLFFPKLKSSKQFNASFNPAKSLNLVCSSSMTSFNLWFDDLMESVAYYFFLQWKEQGLGEFNFTLHQVKFIVLH